MYVHKQMGVNMRRGKTIGIVLMAAMSLMLTACGESVPEMTEEENAQVVEYAAGLLLKYDQNYETRLVEEDPKAEEKASEKKKTESAEVKEEPQAPQKKNQATNTSAVETNNSAQGFYGIKGVEVKYMGYELKDVYPDGNMEESSYAMSAESGYKLLVLNFEMKNTTEQDVDVNMASTGVKFKISVNGGQPEYALTTILPNDLSTFMGTISVGDTKNLILIGEVPEKEAGSIWSVALALGDGSSTDSVAPDASAEVTDSTDATVTN
ncbi:hypothetical protein EDD76_1241 [Kineothrix alysoides]|uniref:DUF4352 domain-containing protein n=2 Tax=Kineothrix alysoides TaxID=1469948 RepID=A0A4R1QUQ4_9FIRM|nr:hypothetical protein EDD76_1241 [Kineothrix alysoides]